MFEVDIVPQQQNELRSEVLKTLNQISQLKYAEITTTMPPHQVEEWKGIMTRLENLTTGCFQKKLHSTTS